MNKLLAFLVVTAIAAPALASDCHAPQVVRRLAKVQIVNGHYGHQNYVAVDHHDAIYVQVGSGLREEAIAKKAAKEAVAEIAEELASLKKQLATAQAKLSGKGTFTFSADTGGGGDSGPVVDPPADDSGDSSYGPKTLPFSVPALKNLCAKCHDGPSSSAGFDMSKQMSWAQVNDIQRRTHNDDPDIRMPKDGRITSSERQQIFEWSVSR